MTTSLRNAAAIALCAGLLMLSGCAISEQQQKAQEAAQREAQSAAADTGVALKLARAAREAGDNTSAVNLYKSALAVAPKNDKIRAELGDAQLDTGAVDDAIETFSAIKAKSPAYLNALLGLERAHLMLREPTKALGYADKAVARAPNDKRAQVGRGIALDMLGRHKEAQPCYRAALAIAPHDVAARSDLALSLAFTGGFDEAIKLLTPLARAPSATPRLRQNLALIYGLKGDMAAARALEQTDLSPQQVETNLKFFKLVRERREMPLRSDSRPSP